jgi:hypothetical protein
MLTAIACGRRGMGRARRHRRTGFPSNELDLWCGGTGLRGLSIWRSCGSDIVVGALAAHVGIGELSLAVRKRRGRALEREGKELQVGGSNLVVKKRAGVVCSVGLLGMARIWSFVGWRYN